MSDVLAILGTSHAKRLVDVAGGTRLYVPKHPGKPPHGGRDGLKRLTRLVGEELAILLIFHFGDSRLYVPRPQPSSPVDAKAVARLTRKGLSSNDIAIGLGCSERTVRKHRARTRTGSTVRKRTLERKGGPPMNMPAPTNPEKALSLRFEAVGVSSDAAQPFNWYVLDRTAPTEIPGAGGVEIADCRERKGDAERIAYALNTIGRLLGDSAEPYFIDDVERLANALERIAARSSSRSVASARTSDIEISTMFGAEANSIALGAGMLRRMLAELLKFALVGDTVEAQAIAWLGRAYPQVNPSTFATITAATYLAQLRDAYTAGMIAGMTRGLDVAGVVERVTRDVCELPGLESGDDPEQAMTVTPDDLALIVRRALGEDV